jgi:hypothetical protein
MSDRNRFGFRKSNAVIDAFFLPLENAERRRRLLFNRTGWGIVLALAVSFGAVALLVFGLQVDLVSLFLEADLIRKITMLLIPAGYLAALVFGIIFLFRELKTKQIRDRIPGIDHSYSYTVMRITDARWQYPSAVYASNRMADGAGETAEIRMPGVRGRAAIGTLILAYKHYGNLFAIPVTALAREDRMLLGIDTLVDELDKTRVSDEGRDHFRVEKKISLIVVGAGLVMWNAVALFPLIWSNLRSMMPSLLNIGWPAGWISLAETMVLIIVQGPLMALLFILPLLEALLRSRQERKAGADPAFTANSATNGGDAGRLTQRNGTLAERAAVWERDSRKKSPTVGKLPEIRKYPYFFLVLAQLATVILATDPGLIQKIMAA